MRHPRAASQTDDRRCSPLRRIVIGLIVAHALLGPPTGAAAVGPRTNDQAVLLAIASGVTGSPPTQMVRQVIGQPATLAWRAPHGVAISALAVSGDGSTVYATGIFYTAVAAGDTTGGLIARSDDAGRHWQVVSAHGPDIVWTLAVDPRDTAHLLAARGNQLLASHDGGHTWSGSAIPDGISHGGIHSIAFDPHLPRSIWVATDGGVGLLHSQDGGTTWAAVPKVVGIYGGTVWRVAVSAATGDVVWAATAAGVYQSIDGGNTWVRLGRGLPEAGNYYRMAASAVAPSHAYAIDAASGVFATQDGGTRWTQAIRWTQPGSLTQVATDPVSPDVAYLSIGGKVLRTRDGGETWRPASSTYQGADYTGLIALPPGGAAR